MIEDLRKELDLFNLLRLLFIKEPTKELIYDFLKLSPIKENESEVVSGLNLLIKAVKRNENRMDEYLEDLSVEYARLFIGPAPPPAVPFASFYLSESKSLMTEETIEVRRKYLEAGLAVKNIYSMPEDHIGIELEFVYFLTERIIKLLEENKQEDALKWLKIRDSFIKEHMLKWVLSFAEKILENTQEDFYKGSALLLKGFFSSWQD